MFEDFSPDESRKARKRFGGSMLVATVLYAGLSAALIGASAEARQIVEEHLTQIAFAPPPPKPAPPPPPAAPESPPAEPVAAPEPPRPKPKRRPLVAPPEVPDEKPPESDQPLAAAEPVLPLAGVTGSLNGILGGTGTAPAPRPVPPKPAPRPAAPPPRPVIEKLIAPSPLATAQPKYPASARRKGIEGVVIVAFEVLEDGRVVNPRIVSGPRELHETVLETVLTWRFKPARRGAVALRYRMQHTVRFRLEDGF